MLLVLINEEVRITIIYKIYDMKFYWGNRILWLSADNVWDKNHIINIILKKTG